ncbi:MAG: VOC family protein [Oscillospiraceae bacterium]|jgi:lactoylglutathione lyase|nr:VOC family protein [Oscillospiraceae bacterium]
MKLIHTSIHVTDLERSLKFYKDALDLEVQMEIPWGGKILTYLGDNARAGAQVELTYDPRRGGEKYNIGEDEVVHLGFLVENADERKIKHRQMGCIVRETEIGIWFITDPDGYWLEMVPDTL